jgi:hypothetical protein
VLELFGSLKKVKIYYGEVASSQNDNNFMHAASECLNFLLIDFWASYLILICHFLQFFSRWSNLQGTRKSHLGSSDHHVIRNSTTIAVSRELSARS